MLAIIGASGKIGGATLDALISYKLIPSSSIVACTSTEPQSETWQKLAAKGVHVRHASFSNGAAMERAFQGCETLFLVSSPRIELDYPDAGPGTGREKDHAVAIDAALRAGVKRIIYTSLAFQSPSKAAVMRAHTRTEAHLRSLSGVNVTILREGLYNESFPLYLGFFYDHKNDLRDRILVSGDSKISWTDIADLGLATALVITEHSTRYAGKTLYLSRPAVTAQSISEVAGVVSKTLGRDIRVVIVPKTEYLRFYTEELKIDPGHVRWWSSSYDALDDEECLIDDPTLIQLLQSKGRSPKTIEETIQEMYHDS